jgi:hypothetical protein
VTTCRWHPDAPAADCRVCNAPARQTLEVREEVVRLIGMSTDPAYSPEDHERFLARADELAAQYAETMYAGLPPCVA